MDVIGHMVAAPGLSPATSLCRIVGLVGAVREQFGMPPAPMLYVPFNQAPDLGDFVIRTDGRAAGLANDVTAVFAKVDPELPAPPITSYDSVIAENAFGERVNTTLFGALAVLALILALSGIYAVTAYSVEQRTREFGIRKAIGASTASVLRNVLAGALFQSGVGIAIGIVLTAALSRYLTALLYQTSPLDPATFFGAIILFVVCAAVAALLPALRATSVDPATALRHQ